jgi:O-antigen/teichoic acid export membrane protein
VLSPVAVPMIFGADFWAAVPVAQVLFAATLPAAVTTVAGAGLLGIGRPGLSTVAQVTGLAATLVALVLLVPPLGALGAALASLVAYAVVALVMAGMFCRLTGVTARELLIPRRGDVADILSLFDLRRVLRATRR